MALLIQSFSVIESGRGRRDVTEEGEDNDNDGIRLATLESRFENKETVFNNLYKSVMPSM